MKFGESNCSLMNGLQRPSRKLLEPEVPLGYFSLKIAYTKFLNAFRWSLRVVAPIVRPALISTRFLMMYCPEELLRTHICVFDANARGSLPRLVGRLGQYHQTLYSVAERDSLSLSRTVSAYNRLARWKLQPTTFEKPEEYAQCLRRHRRPGTA